MKLYSVIFVYHKDNKIKILSIETDKCEHQNLLDEGYSHTATLNSALFLENLFNYADEIDVKQEIKKLAEK